MFVHEKGKVEWDTALGFMGTGCYSGATWAKKHKVEREGSQEQSYPSGVNSLQVV